jgi:RNA-directed DNA polymerase
LVNTDDPWPTPEEAEARVLKIQTKLHQWAINDPDRRFDDLFNLVADPAFLTVAWDRVRGNRGARSAGIDGVVPRSILFGEVLLSGLRAQLKAQTFRPQPVRERTIPKAGGKLRRLGIPAARDRVAQASLKLVLEPIFEADFRPCSYGFRPKRRAQDAVAEIHHLASHSYEWVLEGDITACFDEISHPALVARMRERIGDKRVLRLVKAFLKAGVLGEDGVERDTVMGTPQGGILSPLLANIALSVLDDHFAVIEGGPASTKNDRDRRRRNGLANYRLIRYADDFVVMVNGTEHHVAALHDEVAAVLATMGLRLSEAKTKIVHIDEGFDFLGFRIQRRTKRGTNQRAVYTYPSKNALQAIIDKVRNLTRRSSHPSLVVLLRRLNPALRGWCNYFRHGVSAATFSYLGAFAWGRVAMWLHKRHRRLPWNKLRNRYLPGWRPTEDGITLFHPNTVAVTRYRFRGYNIPTPWTSSEQPAEPPAA